MQQARFFLRSQKIPLRELLLVAPPAHQPGEQVRAYTSNRDKKERSNKLHENELHSHIPNDTSGKRNGRNKFL